MTARRFSVRPSARPALSGSGGHPRPQPSGPFNRTSMKRTLRTFVTRASTGDGSTLIEVMGAMTLVLIVAAGLLSMDSVSTKITENYGHLSSRATEYAEDKMEQLLVLAYGDTTSNTAVF